MDRRSIASIEDVAAIAREIRNDGQAPLGRD